MLKWFDCDSPFAWFNLCIYFHQAESTNNAAGGEVSDDDFVPPRSPYCRRFFWPGQVLRAHIRHVPNASNSWTWASRGFHRIVRCVTRTRPPTLNGMLKYSWITCWRKKRVQKCAFLLKSASFYLIHGCNYCCFNMKIMSRQTFLWKALNYAPNTHMLASENTHKQNTALSSSNTFPLLT